MLPEKQNQPFEAFYDATETNELIDQKTTIMIQLASSFALGCYPCMEYYFGVAKENGLTDEEIGTVQSIAMAVSAARIKAQFREVRENMNL